MAAIGTLILDKCSEVSCLRTLARKTLWIKCGSSPRPPYHQSNHLPLSRAKSLLNSVPNNKIIALTKFKAFADDQFNITKMMISVFDRTMNKKILWKTLWKKEKMLLTRISSKMLITTSVFSFSKGFFPGGVEKSGMCGIGLTHYHTIPHFDALKKYIAVENIVRKGETACYSNFSFSHNVFYDSIFDPPRACLGKD